MTVRLLVDWLDSRDGRQYRAGNLLTTDSGTESGLVAAKLADTTITGGTSYRAPAVPEVASQAELMGHLAQHTAMGFGATSSASRTIAWDFARDGASSVSVVSASCTISTAIIDGEPCLKITGTSAAQAQIDIDLSAAPIAFNGGLGMDVVSERATSNSLVCLASADAGFAAYIQFGTTPPAAAVTSPLTYRSVQPYLVMAHPGGAVADPSFAPGYQGTWVGTPPTYPIELSKLRIRITNQTSQIPVAYLRRVYALAPRKSRVVISLDDGYAAAYRLLKPVLDAYQLKASWSIIADLIGATSLYMQRADLERLFAEGHELVSHGPIAGTGNVVDNYSSVADALADAESHRDTLSAWGLMTPRASAVYVWPQGKHQAATDDTAYRDAMRAAGFTTGRTASPVTAGLVSDLWPDKLLLPIIGHTQAASSGAEATNITALVNRINDAALRGTDVILMLHTGVASTDTAWGSNGGLNIRTTDLATICAAINTNVIAGTQQSARLGDL